MKGVILDKKGKSYTILTDKGDYMSKKFNKSYKVGEEIEVGISSFNYRSFSAAAVFILVGILAFNMLMIPYGYAEVSINPSVELGYNRLYSVIKAEGLNADGIKLLNENNRIKGMKVEDAVEYLIAEADADGYMSKTEENYVVIAYTSKDGKLNSKLEYKVKEKTQNSGADLTLMNMEQNKYSDIRDKKDNPAVEGLKEKLTERNIPEEEFQDVEEVKELAKMLKNSEKEKNENGKPEDVGPPDHANPPGQEKEQEQNNDDKGEEDKDNSGNQGNEGDSNKPGKGNSGQGSSGGGGN